LPVAEVFDERAVVVGAGPLGVGRERPEVGLDRPPGQLHVVRGERGPHADRAISPEGALDLHDR
jgi:hypothetical protein